MNLEEKSVRGTSASCGEDTTHQENQKFRFPGFCDKIGISGFPGGSYPHHKKPTFPGRTFLQKMRSGDQVGLGSLPGADGFPVRKHSEMASHFFLQRHFLMKSRKLDQYSSEKQRSSAFEQSISELRPIPPKTSAVALSWFIVIINQPPSQRTSAPRKYSFLGARWCSCF